MILKIFLGLDSMKTFTQSIGSGILPVIGCDTDT